MFKFIKLFFFLGLIGLGAYFLAVKSLDEQPIKRFKQEHQPDARETVQTDLVRTTDVDSNLRPKQSDETSEKLISNYLAASGGISAYSSLKNITASGTIIEAGHSKSFELIETKEGQRQLTYSWKHLGRNYKMLYSFDGIHIWQQQLLPPKAHPEFYEGPSAWHFAHQRWLIQPFVAPQKANFVFQYQGKSKVNGRTAYIICSFDKDNKRSWFHFDAETFLLTRWGGKSEIAGVEEYIDYRATSFIKVNEVLLPQKIELLLRDSPFGTITFETIAANQVIDPGIFDMPLNKVPTLRQSVKEANNKE